MTPPLTPEEIERIARKRAGAKLGWYVHLTLYLLVNLLLFAIASRDVSHRPWSMYPAFGWGIGVLLHGIAVFVLGSGSGLRERMVRNERERLERQQRER